MSNEDIPSAEKSQNTANEQESIGGQRKEVKVESYQNAASLAQLLKNLDFPADKNQIIAYAERQDIANELISRLRKIEDKQYSNVSEVAIATRIVS
jgi:hypothetical protein